MFISQTLIVSCFLAIVASAAHVGSEAPVLKSRHAHLARRADHVVPVLKKRASNNRKSCKSRTSSSVAPSSTSATPTSTSTSTTSEAPSTTSKAAKTSAAAPAKNNAADNSNDNNDSGSDSGSHSGTVSKGSMTPGGKKAGIAGGDSYWALRDHIGSWSDWTPTPNKNDPNGPVAVPMLWGDGKSGSDNDYNRLQTFKKIATPQYVVGFEEPDCASGGGSAGMSVGDAVSTWNQYIAPLASKGTSLGSPSMCKQAAETFLKPFKAGINGDWDMTTVHINKYDRAGIEADLDHYAQYGKTLWITEFACVHDDEGFTPCQTQGEIDAYINMAVDIFENDSRVSVYWYSDGEGLGNLWPSWSNGHLSASGQTYLNAIKKYSS